MPERVLSGTVLAATTVGRLNTEIREYPFPDIAPDAGILQIEAAGVCGSDWRSYQLDRPARIMGHENVGRIYRIGPMAARRWNVKEGDRVALEEYLPCGYCELCRSGEFRLCEQTESRHPGALRYGSTPVSEPPGLWGGYSQFQYLHPDSVLHKVPEELPPELAAMCLPIANGIQWTYLDGRAGPGKTVLIQGPGQQGLACVLAAKAAGADYVIVAGLARDARRLEIAKALGADFAITVGEDDLESRVREISQAEACATIVPNPAARNCATILPNPTARNVETLESRISGITKGKGVDISIDTAGAGETLVSATRLTRKNGIVLFAAAPTETPADFRISHLLDRRLTLRPCRGHSYEAVDLALRCLASRKYPLHLMATHRFPLAEVDLAIRSVGGQGSPGAIHVTVLPWS
jgi:threonine dehydrogenase-like Zn-dependent dehydrogenase